MSHHLRSPPTLQQVLFTPTEDLGDLFGLGVLGVPLVQYLAWSDSAGVFSCLDERGEASVQQIVDQTSLNERGVDAMLGILASLRIVHRGGDGRYCLSELAKQYLVTRSPYYVGLSLYGMLKTPLPKELVTGRASVTRHSTFYGTLRERLRAMVDPYHFGRPERLRIQHSRNFPAGVAAARSGQFDQVRHLVDLAGGTGVTSIPLALNRPDIQITLIDLPRSVPTIRKMLAEYGVDRRIRVIGHNLHDLPWPVPPCDGILMGNLLHAFDDEECRVMLRRCLAQLVAGGRLWLHEMLWNDNKDGPVVTALWNFRLRLSSAGRQRTTGEFASLLEQTGFQGVSVVPTLGGFSLVTAAKPDPARP